MPRHKDFKRLVRARMRKTGEAYTAARAHLATQVKAPATPEVAAELPPPGAPTSIDYAAIAGMSDDKVKAKTGCTWERWTRALDRLGAEQLSHREITALVRTKYKTDPWWTQMVTVGYERIKGLRSRGQQRDGTYQTSKSRTYAVPVTTLFEAWADPSVRRRWLAGDMIKIRTSVASRSMRLDWNAGGIVAVSFAAKGKSKSTVTVEHTKLPDQQTTDGIKGYWSDRLDELGDVLSQLSGKSVARKRSSAQVRSATPRTIDEYLAPLPQDKQAALEKLRQAIRSAAPLAEECISYQLPTFRLEGKMLVSFGAAAKHCAFYAGAHPVKAHAAELEAYDTSKGTIRFSVDRPLPTALVRRLVKTRLTERFSNAR